MVDGAGERRDVAVYIVTIEVPTSEFRARLESLAGARLIRELPPGRVVVALASALDRQRLAALPGVTAVVPDRLEHPDRPAGPGPASTGTDEGPGVAGPLVALRRWRRAAARPVSVSR